MTLIRIHQATRTILCRPEHVLEVEHAESSPRIRTQMRVRLRGARGDIPVTATENEFTRAMEATSGVWSVGEARHNPLEIRIAQASATIPEWRVDEDAFSHMTPCTREDLEAGFNATFIRVGEVWRDDITQKRETSPFNLRFTQTYLPLMLRAVEKAPHGNDARDLVRKLCEGNVLRHPLFARRLMDQQIKDLLASDRKCIDVDAFIAGEVSTVGVPHGVLRQLLALIPHEERKGFAL